MEKHSAPSGNTLLQSQKTVYSNFINHSKMSDDQTRVRRQQFERGFFTDYDCLCQCSLELYVSCDRLCRGSAGPPESAGLNSICTSEESDINYSEATLRNFTTVYARIVYKRPLLRRTQNIRQKVWLKSG